MFKNKTIVICQSALHFLSGSEIVTLELSEYFKNQGAKVLVFTWFLSDPIKCEFDRQGITVTTDSEDKRLLKADYIWVHHQAIPKIILENIKKLNMHFLFFHMSATDTIYLEQPYIYGLEEKLASKVLYVSEEAMKFGTEKYPSVKSRAEILRNWVPERFCNYPFTPSDKLKRVLVVSNHTPEEVVGLKGALLSHGVDVDFIGSNGECTLIKPEILADADVVVTIGKTVQYCLGMGLPVYVYDHFGGPGFLTEKNYEKTRSLNFSGRGYKKKTTDDIANEILSDYEKAKEFQIKNRVKFVEEFSIATILPDIFKKVEKRDFSKLGDEFIASSIGALWLVRERCVADNCLVQCVAENKRLASEVGRYSSAYESLKNSRTVRVAEKVKRLAKRSEPDPFSLKNGYTVETIQSPGSGLKTKIIGMIRIKNESLILDDTLNNLERIVDGFILLDDNSSDDSVEIAKHHSKCLAIIRHKKTVEGDRSMEESIHRQLLLDEARKYNPDWLFYQDADERIEDTEAFREYMLENTDNERVSGIKLSLFDAYMTKNDMEPYEKGELFGFRKMFGRERRDILMAWKNTESATFKTKADMREPDGIDLAKVETRFYVQHYGKAISEDQWEETCDYYVKHFPGYAKKWEARKGKAVHDKYSDFGTELMTWNEVKKDGGILIS
ncbi:glycosyltransferase family 2 protein [Candidatus Saccharibacteria bacterium]|nr:glycosyltransferase family 2 protein [Candidatus Saccharibacteria bacterium]